MLRRVSPITDPIELRDLEILFYYNTEKPIRSEEDYEILKQYALVEFVNFGLGRFPEAWLTTKGRRYLVKMTPPHFIGRQT